VSLQVFATLLLGGVAVLDATPIAQTLLSQPLVTATLLGAIWGEWRVALEVGVVLQLMAASTSPMGSRTPEDYASGGVVGAGVALAIVSQQHLLMLDDAAALVGVFAGLVTATFGVPLIKWQRRRNEGLSRWCEAEVRRGDAGATGAAQRAGMALAFAAGVGYCAACLALGVGLLGPLAGRYSLRLARAWMLAQPLWIGFGLAQLLHAFVQRRLTRVALFAMATLAAWLLLMMTGQ
jgi:mannose/fructose/N-acetylgalactosamine-specific phosphotransferase system component IIC